MNWEVDPTKGKFIATERIKRRTHEPTKFHILRVFHTVQAWLGEDLDPRNFGFYKHNGTLEPRPYEDGIAYQNDTRRRGTCRYYWWLMWSIFV